MILLITALLICTPMLWWYLTVRKYKTLHKIPGPTPLPFIGNILDLGNTPQDLAKNTWRLRQKYGKIYKVFVGSELKVVISDPDLIETILSSNVHITKSDAYDLLVPWLGIGLLISTGQKWKSRRKMITPTFHFKILDQFLEIFNSAGNILIKKLSEEVGKGSIDIFSFINLTSLDIICETSMGVKINAQEENNTEYVEAVRGYLEIFTKRMFSPFEKAQIMFRLFSGNYTLYKRFLEVLHKFSNNVIFQRREERSKLKPDNSSEEYGIKRKVALLDMLLECQDKNLLSLEDIRAEIDTFMFEGHDTTTSGIAFAVLALADNPDVQEKVYQEIQSVLGDDEKITMTHLQDTKYLEMVIREVQRIYPSVPLVERRLEMDSNIGGYDFPKGTTLNIFVYGLHRSKEYFSNPEKFDPDRFLPENQIGRHNFAYVPFSAGPRNCIGQKFAMLEMKSTIIKIVRNFRILPIPHYKPELGMAAILKSFNGVRVELQKR